MFCQLKEIMLKGELTLSEVSPCPNKGQRRKLLLVSLGGALNFEVELQ